MGKDEEMSTDEKKAVCIALDNWDGFASDSQEMPDLSDLVDSGKAKLCKGIKI
ncbi:Uncharacterised protein [uncultured archaeon]|nr:Uncharacterised protein [uncultured archaeon]